MSPSACPVISQRSVRRVAPRFGLIDRPAARKVHETPTPLGGGIAVIFGVTVPMVGALVCAILADRGALPSWLVPEMLAPHAEGAAGKVGEAVAILAAGAILAVTGLVDDIRPVPWQPRLLIQIIAAAIVAIFGPRLSAFIESPVTGMFITAGWVLVLVNAFNFLDNMDGLAGGIGLIASCLFAVIMLTALSEPRWFVAAVLLILAGSLTGFLWWNWPPAGIFMGDSGSYFVGLMLSSMTIVGTFYEQSPELGKHVMLAPLCVLAVPLYDFTTVLLIRLSQGRSPFTADKSHFSHRLVELGLQPRSAVLTVHLATLTTGLGGLRLYRGPGWTSAVVVLGLIACVLFIVTILETAGRAQRGRSKIEEQ